MKYITQFLVLPLLAVSAAAASLTLHWDDNSTGEKGFQVERATGPGEFIPVHATAENVTSYVDTAVSPGETYRYRVLAFDAFSKSTYSNVATVNLAPALAPPGNVRGEQNPLIVVNIPPGSSIVVTANEVIKQEPKS